MKEGLRPYRLPIVVSIVMLLALSGWAWRGWRDIAERAKEQRRQFALWTLSSMEGVIREIGLKDEVARSRVKAFFSGIMNRPPVLFAIVEADGKRLLEAGRAPASLSLSSTEGEMQSEGEFILWRTVDLTPHDDSRNEAAVAGSLPASTFRPTLVIGIERPPDGPGEPAAGVGQPHGGPGGPMPGVEQPPGGPEGTVIATTPPVGGLKEPVAGIQRPPGGFIVPSPTHVLLMSAAVALLLLTVSLAAWVMAIRGRLLAEQLQAERSRRTYLEELGLAAAGLAHETKNPLGIILGLAQQIAKNPREPAESRVMVEHIMDEVDRATARLGSFMTYARQRTARPAAMNVHELGAKVATILQPDFGAAGVTLGVDCAALRIMADEEMLEQILVNLLLNSLHASKAGSSVALRVQRRGTEATLTVEDRGHGIAAELLPDIFKPYVAGSAEGHGLGLAIVGRLVDEHGWTIDIRSQVGQGTVVTVSGIALAKAEEVTS